MSEGRVVKGILLILIQTYEYDTNNAAQKSG